MKTKEHKIKYPSVKLMAKRIAELEQCVAALRVEVAVLLQRNATEPKWMPQPIRPYINPYQPLQVMCHVTSDPTELI